MSTYYIAGFPISDELYHHGIKGQKWGIRRYQNEDGTLTAAGKARYGTTENFNNARAARNEKLKKAGKVALGVAGAAALTYGGYKLASNPRVARRINDIRSTMQTRRDLAGNSEQHIIRRMEDAELNRRIDRLTREARLRTLAYEALTSSANPRTQMAINAGRKVLETAITGAAAYAGYSLTSKIANGKRAADYMFANPNKKK